MPFSCKPFPWTGEMFRAVLEASSQHEASAELKGWSRYVPRVLARSTASSSTLRSVRETFIASFICLNCDSTSSSRPATSKPVYDVKLESFVRNADFEGEQDLNGENGCLRRLLMAVSTFPRWASMPEPRLGVDGSGVVDATATGASFDCPLPMARAMGCALTSGNSWGAGCTCPREIT